MMYNMWLVWCVFFNFSALGSFSGRKLVKVLLLTVGLCWLVISTALINVCSHLTQRLPDGAVALIMVVCIDLCLCVTWHCYKSHPFVVISRLDLTFGSLLNFTCSFRWEYFSRLIVLFTLNESSLVSVHDNKRNSLYSMSVKDHVNLSVLQK